MKTHQEIYSAVRGHLLTQMAKSQISNRGGFGNLQVDPFCAYRDGNGKSCAVGCLIKDEVYDSRIESRTVSSLRNHLGMMPELLDQQLTALKHALNASGIDTNDETLYFLGKLQRIHDQSAVEDWEEQLNALAIQEDLKPE